MNYASDIVRDGARVRRAADVLRAVAHPVRPRFVAMLGGGDAKSS